jgi:hypothetical protein
MSGARKRSRSRSRANSVGGSNAGPKRQCLRATAAASLSLPPTYGCYTLYPTLGSLAPEVVRVLLSPAASAIIESRWTASDPIPREVITMLSHGVVGDCLGQLWRDSSVTRSHSLETVSSINPDDWREVASALGHGPGSAQPPVYAPLPFYGFYMPYPTLGSLAPDVVGVLLPPLAPTIKSLERGASPTTL